MQIMRPGGPILGADQQGNGTSDLGTDFFAPTELADTCIAQEKPLRQAHILEAGHLPPFSPVRRT
jgi:hypothetical protein